MKSLEALFNDSLWEIRIPNANIESLEDDYQVVTVLFYLQISLPDDLSTLHEETAQQVHDFFKALDIQVEAAFVDPLSLVNTSTPPMQKTASGRPMSVVEKRMSMGGQSPNPNTAAPRPGPQYFEHGRSEATIVYTYTYNPAEKGREMKITTINGLWTAIIPFAVPISFVRTKNADTMLMLSAHVVLRPTEQAAPTVVPVDDQEYNMESYSMVNLLEGLSDDPTYISLSVPRHHYRPDTPRARVPPTSSNTPVLRRSARRTIAIRSALNIRMRTTRVSPVENPLMMSIEVENNSEHGGKFNILQLDVDVTNAVVIPLDAAELTQLPLTLSSVDHVTFLYSISLLESSELNDDQDGSSSNNGSSSNMLQPPIAHQHPRLSGDHHLGANAAPPHTQEFQRQVTISLQGSPDVDGVKGQLIHSRWNCFLDVSDLTKRDGALAAAAAAAANAANPPQQRLLPPHHPHQQHPQQPQQPPPQQPSPHPPHHRPSGHQRSPSLPSSPQPHGGGLNRATSLARRVSNVSSPPALAANRPHNATSSMTESRTRRSSYAASVTSDGASQRGGSASGSGTGGVGPSGPAGGGGGGGGRRTGGWGGLAAVQESSGSRSPAAGVRSPIMGSVIAESETDSYEDEPLQTGGGAAAAGGGVPGSRHGASASGMGGVGVGVGPSHPMYGTSTTGLGLDMANAALSRLAGVAGVNRADHDGGDGIVVTFAVTGRVVVGKIFNLEVFIVNRSRHIRRFTIVVPNRKRAKGGDPSQGSKVLPPLPSGEQAVVKSVPIDPYMEETELLRRHVDNETSEADIICLENNVRLSPLYPLTCQTLNLRFIAIKEQLHTIDLVQLVDNDTGFVINLRNCLCFMAEASFGALSEQLP
ncbi:hypothetical protein BGZ73_009061 [Actinomortierella ambigua]|nr:hypothetical protein BGZ73_009061 [Actinomortierella ambigua]